jgi:hypothetical protein
LGSALEPGFADALLIDFTEDATFAATFALPFGLAAFVFTTGFAVVLEAADLAGAGFAFFAEDVLVFTGFVIAFAM